MQQEKAKKSYRNKKRIYLFVISGEAAQTDKSVFIFAAWRVSKLASDTPRGGSTT